MTDWVQAAREAESRHDLPKGLLVAVGEKESGFNPSAKSGAGAIGLLQLMPGTAKELGVDPYDPYQNLDGGARYLKQQLNRFGGDVKKALAAYNAGPGAVEKYGGVPPFRETIDYVDTIERNWRSGSAPALGAPPVGRATGFNGTPMAGSRDVADLLKQNPMAATALAGLAEPQSESPFEREIKRRFVDAASGKMPSFDRASTRPYSLEDVMGMAESMSRRNPVIDLLLDGGVGAAAAGSVARSAAPSGSGLSGAGGGQEATGRPGFKPIEYLTGDKGHHGYDPSHGGDNYHEHVAFGTPEEARRAAKLLNDNGIQTTELQGVNRVGRHSDKSYHYSGQAFDVPASQVPVGQEQALSRRFRALLGIA